MLSFIISRPCLAFSKPAASTRPSGDEPCRALSLRPFSSFFLIQRHNSFRVSGGSTREGRSVQKRSRMMAKAKIEQATIGTIKMPPAFNSSNTLHLLINYKPRYFSIAAGSDYTRNVTVFGIHYGPTPYH